MTTAPVQLELAALKRNWVDCAASDFKLIVWKLDRFTVDDIHPFLPPPAQPNWFGVLFAKLKNLGLIRRVSAQASTRPEANGRLVSVWEVVR